MADWEAGGGERQHPHRRNGDADYVTVGRWDAEHARLGDRIAALETWRRETEQTRDEEAGRRWEAQIAQSNRRWALVLALLSAGVLPLLVAAVIAAVSVLTH